MLLKCYLPCWKSWCRNRCEENFRFKWKCLKALQTVMYAVRALSLLFCVASTSVMSKWTDNATLFATRNLTDLLRTCITGRRRSTRFYQDLMSLSELRHWKVRVVSTGRSSHLWWIGGRKQATASGNARFRRNKTFTEIPKLVIILFCVENTS